MEMFRGYALARASLRKLKNIIADRDYFMAVIAVPKKIIAHGGLRTYGLSCL